ncbi:MAG: adenosine kinase [Rhodospirillales bacterium]|jgi:sugar/nucleoside kinase (ribokinase family)|nr:adenosine kinase [Rhodospirillales bacterium]
MAARYDVIGIGNAIVDVLAHSDEEFLAAHGLAKGAMTLIDADTAKALYDAMAPAIECSGGSAANTIAGLASLGATTAFIGKVHDDQLGAIFRHDIRALGVAFETLLATGGAGTARCLIFVTADAQRTMQTYLGACVELGPGDIDDELVAASKVAYLEGYLWDPPGAKEAFILAATIVRQAGRTVALSLSDPFCVDRHRDDFCDLVNDHVDVLFANEEEIKSLYQVDTFDDAMQRVRGHCRIAALTRGDKGSVVISGDEVHVVDAVPIEHVVDTTGAGDAYAAGFLFGITHDFDLGPSAHIGGIVAAEAISHFGARAEVSLDELVRRELGSS